MMNPGTQNGTTGAAGIALDAVTEAFASRSWDGSARDIAADAVAHLIWLAVALGALGLAPWSEMTDATRLYAMATVAMALTSTIHNMTPRDFVGGWSGRIDCAFIYVVIAAAVGAFLALGDPSDAMSGADLTALMVVWLGALAGAAMKIGRPRHYHRVGLALYIGLGFTALIGITGAAEVLGTQGMALLAAGGLLYLVGVPFHLAKGMAYRQAIWHLFVAAATGCHIEAMRIGLSG